MTVTLELPPETERQLASRAAARGQDVPAYVRSLVERDLDTGSAAKPPLSSRARATLDLLAQWDKEDETDDPAEIERRRREWEDLKEALNASRVEVGARKLFP